MSTSLALFDFDGTITVSDTYTSFIKSVTPLWRQLIGGALLLPWIIGYKKGLVSGPTVRSKLSRVAFFGVPGETLDSAAVEFGKQVIPPLIRKDVLERIHWHQQRGDRVIVVSASLRPYLEIWTKEHGLELICNDLEKRNGRYTGRTVDGDCSGEEKVRRIKRFCALASFDKVFAYGDTKEDYPMLRLADEKFLCGKKIEFC